MPTIIMHSAGEPCGPPVTSSLTESRRSTQITDNYQNTGASRKKIRFSSFCTHRAMAFAALMTAVLGSKGDIVRYSSYGFVIYSGWGDG